MFTGLERQDAQSELKGPHTWVLEVQGPSWAPATVDGGDGLKTADAVCEGEMCLHWRVSRICEIF